MTETAESDREFKHYGTPRHSGRYPWGSGGDSEERSRSFLGYAEQLRKQGLSEVQRAEGLGFKTTTELRAALAIAKDEVHAANVAFATRLHEKGLSNVAIGQRMGLNESTVRTLLNPLIRAKRDILITTANLLKNRVDQTGFLDIGEGTENHLSISKTKLATAVAILKSQGYVVHTLQVPQVGTTNKTTFKVLASPGTTWADVARNRSLIKTVAAYSEDSGRTYLGIEPPVNIDTKRVSIRYAEQGGSKADGVIYLRPGVEDLSLGSSHYAQVRIAVGGTHYLKGMAMYKNDLPPGVDIQFNTNKSDTGNPLDAMKSQKAEDNPFGATVRQRHYLDKQGKKQLSPLNIVNEEGDWGTWSKSLSSQFLSKQSTPLAQRQLDLSLAQREEELRGIENLTNPVVKKKLLQTFADDADSASVHLKAASLPRQGTHVILPLEDINPNEIYARNFRNGEKVALIRHPHGGTFEIPELTVNNKHAGARATLGYASDAVGIHPDVAQRLSGADFDGDHVLVIPNNRNEVKTSAPLSGLKDFDPKNAYPPFDGMRTIDGGVWVESTKKVDYGTSHPSGRAKQQQMGNVSNLITDMTIKGAKADEIARAVRHSMTVIDAEKHNLNYRQSEIDNGITALKEKYQGRGPTGRLAGASTIISRASSQIHVLDRTPRSASEGGPIDAETGARVFVSTNEVTKDRLGRETLKTIASKKLAETADAHTLSSGMPIEGVYANHSNRLKALANDARKSSLIVGGIEYSPSANKAYSKEVESLKSKLELAQRNKPLERQAQLLANTVVSAKRQDNPHMESDELKKVKAQALAAARLRIGAHKTLVDITPEEWRAIQSGAISTSRLRDILDNADPDLVRKYATPRTATVMTPVKLALAQARIAAGYTQAEVADSLGIPVSTLNSALNRKDS